jgi:hypothetical protein
VGSKFKTARPKTKTKITIGLEYIDFPTTAQ